MPLNLLKHQSNQIYLTLTEAGWDASAFEWLETESLNIGGGLFAAKLKHKASEYYFIVDLHALIYYKMSPGYTKFEETGNVQSWTYLIRIFKKWLDYLKREVNTPDLWSELPRESELIESASEGDNSEFNDDEKKIIRKGLEETKQYLLDVHGLDAELVEGHLKYLTESAERLGRKDWKNILISTIFSIIIQGGIAGHSAQEIFQFVWTVLSSVLIKQLYLP